MDTRKAQQLLEKYKAGNCSPQEKAFIDRWYLQEAAKLPMPEGPEDPIAEEQLIWNRIAAELPGQSKVRTLSFRKWAAIAASVLIIFSAGLYFYLNRPTKPNQFVALKASEIKAGGNMAILTLSGGKKIVINNQSSGTIATQGHTTITKNANGQVTYTVARDNTDSEPVYNTIETPAGYQFKVELPDGSKAWLNAASTLKYPVSFTGKERLVQLTGEGYFEVVHNPAMPFKVKTAHQTAKDLGTHFNINAYPDEADTKVTLLEGSIEVTQAVTNSSKIIAPGQQAEITGQVFRIRQVNTAQAAAWKEGLFNFDHTDLHALMRQISRWYNIRVIYEGNVKDDQFFGEVERKYNLAEVLKVLELGGLHFRVEGPLTGNQQKRLIVTP
jgi:transmembrane sensor